MINLRADLFRGFLYGKCSIGHVFDRAVWPIIGEHEGSIGLHVSHRSKHVSCQKDTLGVICAYASLLCAVCCDMTRTPSVSLNVILMHHPCSKRYTTEEDCQAFFCLPNKILRTCLPGVNLCEQGWCMGVTSWGPSCSQLNGNTNWNDWIWQLQTCWASFTMTDLHSNGSRDLSSSTELGCA